MEEKATARSQLLSIESNRTTKDKVLFLFASFIIAYGQSWAVRIEEKEQYEATKKMWSSAISVLTDEEFNYGINSFFVKFEFAPTVIQFFRFCKRIPTIDEAFAMLELGDLSNPIVKRASEIIGGKYEIRKLEDRDLKYKFKRHFNLLVDKVIKGESISAEQKSETKALKYDCKFTKKEYKNFIIKNFGEKSYKEYLDIISKGKSEGDKSSALRNFALRQIR
jgi:hypothetical protein